MWHLRSLMDGRHLLNSSSHRSQEQLTSTICTSIAKWLGGGGQQPPSPEPTMGMWTSEFWGGGVRKALCRSLGTLLHRKDCTPSPQDAACGCLGEPCDHSTGESRSLIPRTGSYIL